MSLLGHTSGTASRSLIARLLPFADAASDELPLSRLLRLSLFQVSVGLTMVLLTGTLNRVMIVELGVPAGIVAVMISLPLLLAPVRALIGYRSDTHRSYLGWRRLPYIVLGTMLQYGGLAVMPFALLILAGDSTAPVWVGTIAAGFAFLVAGAGVHISQTAGLALAADLANEEARPRIVALLYVMLLAGMVVSALVLGALLTDVNPLRLIQVIQGTAVVVIVLNTIALWQQEPRRPSITRHDVERPSFSEAWRRLIVERSPVRLLTAVALGTAAFSMQDILLEPYGGEVLGLAVGATTTLTALLAGGSLVGVAIAARFLHRQADPCRLAGLGALLGIVAFLAVTLAGAIGSPLLFRCGTMLIGLGAGLFAVGTLTAAMDQATGLNTGLALGAWGAVQATATGLAMALGGIVRDVGGSLAANGYLGPALSDASAGYGIVYTMEVALLLATLVAIGPLVRRPVHGTATGERRFGLAEHPG